MTTDSRARVQDTGLRHIEVAQHGHTEKMKVSSLLSLRISEMLVKDEDSQ